MIVRVLGEGQWRVDDGLHAAACTRSTSRSRQPSRRVTKPRFRPASPRSPTWSRDG